MQYVPCELYQLDFPCFTVIVCVLGTTSITQFVHRHQLSVSMISRLRTATVNSSVLFKPPTFIRCRNTARSFPAVSGTILSRRLWLLCRDCLRNIVKHLMMQSLVVCMNQILRAHRQITRNFTYPHYLLLFTTWFYSIFELHAIQ